MHEKADLYYVSAVSAKLNSEVARLETIKAEGKALNEEQAERLERVTDLAKNLAIWTSVEVSRENDPIKQQLALDAFAHAIQPLTEETGLCLPGRNR